MPMSPDAPRSRRRFRPTLVPTLGLVVLVAATVGLGNWQRHRAQEKQALRDRYESAARAPALALDAVAAEMPDAGGLRYRTVRVQGEFVAARQVLIDNKVRAGRAGFDVVTPLRIAGAKRYVLVDRGWIAQGRSRAELPAVPPPAGPVVVEGRIDLPPTRYLELAADPGSGAVRQNLDIGRFAASTGFALLPFIVEQTGGSGDGLDRRWPAPDFDIERHQSYMLQWYSLAALGLVLWIGLNWRADPVDRT